MFGPYDDYSDYSKNREEEIREPSIYKYTQEQITGSISNYYTYPEIYPPLSISLDEEGAEEFDFEYYKSQKVLQGLKRTDNKGTKSSKKSNVQEINFDKLLEEKKRNEKI